MEDNKLSKVDPRTITVVGADEVHEVTTEVVEMIRNTEKTTDELQSLSCMLDRLDSTIRVNKSVAKVCRKKMENLSTEL